MLNLDVSLWHDLKLCWFYVVVSCRHLICVAVQLPHHPLISNNYFGWDIGNKKSMVTYKHDLCIPTTGNSIRMTHPSDLDLLTQFVL